MVSQFGARLVFVILQGSVEEHLERRGWRGVTHIGRLGGVDRWELDGWDVIVEDKDEGRRTASHRHQ
jgi:hypothetical protein